MKARPIATAMRSRIVDRLVSLTSLLYVLEGPQLARHQQVADHHDDRDERERGGEGQVFAKDVVVDDVADELVVGDEARGDVVTQRQGEGEDRSGDDCREGEWQDHPPERRERL